MIALLNGEWNQVGIKRNQESSGIKKGSVPEPLFFSTFISGLDEKLPITQNWMGHSSVCKRVKKSQDDS